MSTIPFSERPASPPNASGSLARWILGAHTHVVLVSQSPRRREILAQLGIPTRVAPVSIDETFHPGETPEAGAMRVALAKARAAAREGDGLLLAADTIVAIEARVLGKPRDAAHAREMLAALSGRTHRVITGVALIAPSGVIATGHETTEVIFRELAPAEIDEYVATGEPLDKAGAYGIQGAGALLVQSIRGDYWNVVGLPVGRVLHLSRELARQGSP